MNIFREPTGFTRLPEQRAEGERISQDEAVRRLDAVRSAFTRVLADLTRAVTRGTAEERQELLRVSIDMERRLQVAELVHEQASHATQEVGTSLERRIMKNPELCQSMSPEELCELFNGAAPKTILHMFEAGNLEQAIQFGAFPEMVILDQDGRIDLEGTKHWHSTGRHEQQDGILLNSPLAAVDRREPVSLWDFLRRRTGQVR